MVDFLGNNFVPNAAAALKKLNTKVKEKKCKTKAPSKEFGTASSLIWLKSGGTNYTHTQTEYYQVIIQILLLQRANAQYLQESSNI